MKRNPVRALHTDAVDIKPRDFDWSEGYPQRWEYYQAERCEACNEPLVVCGEAYHYQIDEDTGCEGYVCAEGPMMNYFYELPCFDRRRGPVEAAKMIVDLPLCIVCLVDEDEYGLALTGGGMNLSWEICEAYIVLGYLPPLHFCDLPVMAGLKLDTRTRWILAGCSRSADMTARRAKSIKAQVRRIRQLTG